MWHRALLFVRASNLPHTPVNSHPTARSMLPMFPLAPVLRTSTNRPMLRIPSICPRFAHPHNLSPCIASLHAPHSHDSSLLPAPPAGGLWRSARCSSTLVRGEAPSKVGWGPPAAGGGCCRAADEICGAGRRSVGSAGFFPWTFFALSASASAVAGDALSGTDRAPPRAVVWVGGGFWVLCGPSRCGC